MAGETSEPEPTELDAHCLSATPDGTAWAFQVPPSAAGVSGPGAWMARMGLRVVPVSYVIGMIVAQMVQWQGWWLINEWVLTWRWLLGASLVWGALVLMVDLAAWRRPPTWTVTLNLHTLSLVHAVGPLVVGRQTVPLRDVTTAVVAFEDGFPAVLVGVRGQPDQILEIDTTSAAAWELAYQIRDYARRALESQGSVAEIPKGLWRLRRGVPKAER